jgi:cysteine-S-conjugate beta-lyase
MTKPIQDRSILKPSTRLATAAREFTDHGFVNPPLYRGSTVLMPDIASLANNPHAYGRRGSPTVSAINAAVAELEGGHDARVMPSGLSAISTTLLATLNSGDHLLVTDAVYYPARHFCDTFLSRLGVEVSYFDPLLGHAVAELIRPNTKLIYCESPGSQTMEIMDIPAIADAARRKGCRVLVDNSWSGGHYCKPILLGADMSLQSGSKYIGGHSDILFGTVSCTKETMPILAEGYGSMGMFTGPDDIVLALRGMRTLEVRLARHMESAMVIADWLQKRPEVARVMYPALPGDPRHELWKRDFTGASGLFSIELRPCSDTDVARMVDGLQLFGIGFGWGGFESMCIPFKIKRTATTWQAKGPALRLHIGMEHPDDLMRDLEAGFERLAKAR